MSQFLPIPPLTTPISILPDQSLSETSHLRIKHHTKGGFTISQTSTASNPTATTLFTSTPNTNPLSPLRQLHNPAGKPILTLHRPHACHETTVSIPDTSLPAVAIVAPRYTRGKNKVDVFVRCGKRMESKEEGEEAVKVEVRGLDHGKKETVVQVGEEVAMRVESLSGWMGRVPGRGREWAAEVAGGFDLALAASIVIFLGTTMHDNTRFKSEYGMEIPAPFPEAEKRERSKWMMIGAAAGAGAGAAC